MDNDLRITKISRLLEKVLENKIQKVSEANKCSLLYQMNNKYKVSGERIVNEDNLFTRLNIDNKSNGIRANEKLDFTFAKQVNNLNKQKEDPDLNSYNKSKKLNTEIENLEFKKNNFDLNNELYEKSLFCKTSSNFNNKNTINNFYSSNDYTYIKKDFLLKDEESSNNNNSINYNNYNDNNCSRNDINEINKKINNNINKLLVIENKKTASEDISSNPKSKKMDSNNLKVIFSKKIENSEEKQKQKDLCDAHHKNSDFDDIFQKIKMLKNSRINEKNNYIDQNLENEKIFTQNINSHKIDISCEIKEANKVNTFKVYSNKKSHTNSPQKINAQEKEINGNVKITNLKNSILQEDLFATKIPKKPDIQLNKSPESIIKDKLHDKLSLKTSTDFFSINNNNNNLCDKPNYKFILERLEELKIESCNKDDNKKISNFSKTDPASFKMINNGFVIANTYSRHNSLIFQSNKINKENENLDKNTAVKNLQFSLTPDISYRNRKNDLSSEKENPDSKSNKSVYNKSNSIDSKRKSIHKASATFYLFNDLINKNLEKEPVLVEQTSFNEITNYKQSQTLLNLDFLQENKYPKVNFRSLKEIRKFSPKKANLKEFKVNFDDLNTILLKNSNRYRESDLEAEENICNKKNEIISNQINFNDNRPTTIKSDTFPQKLFSSNSKTQKIDYKQKFNSNAYNANDSVENPIFKNDDFKNEIELLKMIFSADNIFKEASLKRSKSAQAYDLVSNRYGNNSIQENPKADKQSEIYQNKMSLIDIKIKDIRNMDYNSMVNNIKLNDNENSTNKRKDLIQKRISNSIDYNSQADTRSNVYSNADSKRIINKKDYSKELNNNYFNNISSMLQMGCEASNDDNNSNKNINRFNAYMEYTNQGLNNAEVNKNDFTEFLQDKEKFGCSKKINNTDKHSNLIKINKIAKIEKIEDNKNPLTEKFNFEEKINIKENLINDNKKHNYDINIPYDYIIHSNNSNKILSKSRSLFDIEKIDITKKIPEDKRTSEINTSLILNSEKKFEAKIKKSNLKKNQLTNNKKKSSVKLEYLPNFSKIEEVFKHKKKISEGLNSIKNDNTQETIIYCRDSTNGKNTNFIKNEEILLLIPEQRNNAFHKNSFYDLQNAENLNTLNDKKQNDLNKFNKEIFNFSKNEINKQILLLWKSNQNSFINIKCNLATKEIDLLKIDTQAKLNKPNNSLIVESDNQKEIDNINNNIKKPNLLINLEKKNLENSSAKIIEKVKKSREMKINNFNSNSAIAAEVNQNSNSEKNSHLEKIDEKQDIIIPNNEISDLKSNNAVFIIPNSTTDRLIKEDSIILNLNEESIISNDIDFNKNIIDISKFKTVAANPNNLNSYKTSKNKTQVKPNIRKGIYGIMINNLNNLNNVDSINNNKAKKTINEKEKNLEANANTMKNAKNIPSKTTEAFYSKPKSDITLEMKNNFYLNQRKSTLNKNTVSSKNKMIINKNKNNKELNIISVQKIHKNIPSNSNTDKNHILTNQEQLKGKNSNDKKDNLNTALNCNIISKSNEKSIKETFDTKGIFNCLFFNFLFIFRNFFILIY